MTRRHVPHLYSRPYSFDVVTTLPDCASIALTVSPDGSLSPTLNCSGMRVFGLVNTATFPSGVIATRPAPRGDGAGGALYLLGYRVHAAIIAAGRQRDQGETETGSGQCARYGVHLEPRTDFWVRRLGQHGTHCLVNAVAPELCVPGFGRVCLCRSRA